MTQPKKRKRSDAPPSESPSAKRPQPRPRRRRSTPPPGAAAGTGADAGSGTGAARSASSRPPAPTDESPLLEMPEDAIAGDVPEPETDAAVRMRALEERLDRMIDERARARESSSPPAAHDHEEPPHGRIPPPPPSVGTYAGDFRPADETPSSSVPSRFVEEVDEFGYDPAYERKLMPVLELLYEKYFRVEVHGIERVPGDGRCLLVANHSGALPIDGLMLRLAVRREHPQRRDVRWLAEDGLFHFPFLGNMTNRIGAVRACQENAERLLEHEALVVVFPEGKKGMGKLFRDRYKLQRFGRGGFVKLCLRTRTPIVPVAIVGGEETNPVLARVEYLTRALGIPYVPVTPTFPLLGPVGLLPAPTKWKIFFGEPIDLSGYAPVAADDEILVGRLTERVRGAIQSMLDRAVAERRSVWFG
jgi:1-acyl-sn-glycerol-3-phosphate acyltransferase